MVLTAIQNTKPDYVALAMVLVLVILVAIMAIRKRFSAKPNAQNEYEVSDPVPQAAPQQAAAPGSAGQIKLHNVDPKTAAMLMAIVANKTGKPLNELRFISIKEVP